MQLHLAMGGNKYAARLLTYAVVRRSTPQVGGLK